MILKISACKKLYIKAERFSHSKEKEYKMIISKNQKVFQLLDLISENTCRPLHYPMHQVLCEEKEEKIIRPYVFHALDLVDKMLVKDLDPKDIFKTFKLVLCSHKHEEVKRYLCNAIREEIIFKYIA